MTSAQTKHAIGIFLDRQSAIGAFNELRNTNFPMHKISIFTKNLDNNQPSDNFQPRKQTITSTFPRIRKSEGEWRSMMNELFEHRFTTDTTARSACIEAFARHNERVRNSGLGHRLLEWKADDGWEPLCRALDLEIPEEAFPHENSTATFIQKHL